MGGFIAPDPLEGLAKVFHAFAFIGIPRVDGQQNPRPRFRIRHQNPRLNEPGVAPSRPLRPSDVGVGPVNIIPDETDQKLLSRRTLLPLERSRLRNKIIKKSPNSRRRKSRNPILSRPEADRLAGERSPPTVGVRGKNLIILNEDLVVPPSIEIASIHAHTDRGRNAPEKDIPERVSPEDHNALATLRPRLPHQRLHYIRRIGQGGEGHCDLFRLHAAPQTLLAVKTLNRTPELVRHKNNKRKPLEAHILQDILSTPHPHVVQMFGYTCTPRRTMLYYEYCNLGDLQDVVEAYFSRDVTIPEGFIWHVFLGIAKALAYLHTGYTAPSSATLSSTDSIKQIEDKEWTPILHRDIKPENIFFRPSSSSSPYPTSLLADFGLATNIQPKPCECAGTIVYQGPELPIQTKASDLWSLGATLHTLVHGHPPMVQRAEGRSMESWEWDPRSRRITAIGSRGYSSQLGVAMREVLRKRMEDRIGGRGLVEKVEMGRKDWGGVEVGLREWGFRKMDEEVDGVKVEGKARNSVERG
ncbi:MAG: hypothetical protein Q9224_005314 [Gallowayella concinna]